MPILEDAWINRYDTDEDDHYSQAGDLYRIMDESQKDQLTTTIAEGLVHATESVKVRMLEQFNKADPGYSRRIKARMNEMS